MTISRRTTHSLGVTCAVCSEVLIADDCCKGNPHGSTTQEPGEWPSRVWPHHPCFQET